MHRVFMYLMNNNVLDTFCRLEFVETKQSVGFLISLIFSDDVAASRTATSVKHIRLV